jgi:hypothetical protein
MATRNLWLKASNPDVPSHRLYDVGDELGEEYIYAGRRWAFHRRFRAGRPGADQPWLVYLDSGPADHQPFS